VISRVPSAWTAARRPSIAYSCRNLAPLAERRASASRAATAKHSSVGKEIREVRQLARDLLEIILEDGVLGIRVRRHLQGIVQLLQTYARLAELELTAGEKPRPGDVSLPEAKVQSSRCGCGQKARKRRCGKGRNWSRT
jgi:hypothetical protein